jgi:nicotinate (nicotinamide) nucleotide adenylyltransferase
VGIFGGTFDPIHLGHLVAGVNVRATLGLDVVLFVVANLPWQKIGDRAVTAAWDRFALVDAAVRDVEGLQASAMEIERGDLSYTIDTVDALRERSVADDLHLIVGADVAPELGTWRASERLRTEVTLVVMNRAGPSDRPRCVGRMECPARRDPCARDLLVGPSRSCGARAASFLSRSRRRHPHHRGARPVRFGEMTGEIACSGEVRGVQAFGRPVMAGAR